MRRLYAGLRLLYAGSMRPLCGPERQDRRWILRYGLPCGTWGRFVDVEREHLVEPVRHQERGLAMWVGLALLFAGVIVSAGGLYEWNKRKTGHRPAGEIGRAAPDRLPGEDAEIVRLRRELAA